MKAFIKGAIIGIVANFPLALICALLFRFPVPFIGYMSGPRAFFPVLLAVVFYGLLGGFLIQAVMGGLGGILAEKFSVTSKKDVKKLRIIFSSIGASFAVLVLAMLDKLIGPGSLPARARFKADRECRILSHIGTSEEYQGLASIISRDIEGMLGLKFPSQLLMINR